MNNKKQKHILITGGAGFIGSNMTKRLLEQGHQVTVLDNFVTGSRENLKDVANNTKLTVIDHNISKPLKKIFKKIDVILNYACPASPPAYQKDSLLTLHACSIGVENMLKLALKYNARFLQASTSEVYGNPVEHPQKETYYGNVNSYGPRAMYDEGQRYAEALIWVYRKNHNLNTGIIRIFNTYGPFMSPYDGRVISNFIWQSLNNKPLTIYGDGKQTRSFCYIDDQLDAWEKMIDSDVEGPINIGNPNEITINQLVNIVKKITKKEIKIRYSPLPTNDPLKRRPDISKAKNLLKWSPKIDIEEGVGQTVNWMQYLIK